MGLFKRFKSYNITFIFKTEVWDDKTNDFKFTEVTKVYKYGETPKMEIKNRHMNINEEFYESFYSWSPRIEDVKEDKIYHATYRQYTRVYQITFKSGSYLETTVNYSYGKVPEIPSRHIAKSTKDSIILHTYTEPEIKPVTENITYTVKLREEIKTYKVEWVYNGKIVDAETYEHGQTPTFKKETPIIVINDQYEKKFSHFRPEISEVKENIKYYAVFEKYDRIYEVFWNIGEKTIVTKCKSGEIPIEPKTNWGVSKDTYNEFIKWDKKIAPIINENAEYTAIMKEKEREEFSVSFIDLDNTIISNQIVRKGIALQSLIETPKHSSLVTLNHIEYESILLYNGGQISIPYIQRRIRSNYSELDRHSDFFKWDYDNKTIEEDKMLKLIPNYNQNREIIYKDFSGNILFKSKPILNAFLPLPPLDYFHYDWDVEFENGNVIFKKAPSYSSRWAINFSNVKERIIETFNFRLSGVSFGNRQENIKNLSPNEELVYIREPENVHDKNAILIKTKQDKEIGYISMEDNAQIAKLIDDGYVFKIFVDYISGASYQTQGVRIIMYQYEKIDYRPTNEQLLNIYEKYNNSKVTIEEITKYLLSLVFNKPIGEVEGNIDGLLYYIYARYLERYTEKLFTGKQTEGSYYLAYKNGIKEAENKFDYDNLKKGHKIEFSVKKTRGFNREEEIFLTPFYYKRRNEEFSIEVADTNRNQICIINNRVIYNYLKLGYKYTCKFDRVFVHVEDAFASWHQEYGLIEGSASKSATYYFWVEFYLPFIKQE